MCNDEVNLSDMDAVEQIRVVASVVSALNCIVRTIKVVHIKCKKCLEKTKENNQQRQATADQNAPENPDISEKDVAQIVGKEKDIEIQDLKQQIDSIDPNQQDKLQKIEENKKEEEENKKEADKSEEADKDINEDIKPIDIP